MSDKNKQNETGGKLWQGRFSEGLNAAADSFNSSLPFDRRLYKSDILGSLAHCGMLNERGIIPAADAEKITAALKAILADIESGSLIIKGAEDIHSFVENELVRRIGDAGKKLHTARSRNDQVATDMRLFVMDALKTLSAALKELISTLSALAKNGLYDIIPGYTHTQKAQPVTLAHYFMAYAEMFYRDLTRVSDAYSRTSVLPLGSCALAGTTFNIDRDFVARELGFAAVSQNSLDAVSDRDFCIEFISACTLIMTHLSRFNEEIIMWSTDEFGYITLPDAFSTGSSIMPQKKNPDVSELIRGKSGRVYGHLTALLAVMKGLPLAYNKDMQEDKEAVFDSFDTVIACLNVFTDMLPALKYNTKKMRASAAGGFSAATDAADYLVRKGLPFRAAHEVVGKLVQYCISNNTTLEKLPLEVLKQHSPLFEADIKERLKLKAIVNNRSCTGGPAPEPVKAAIKNLEKRVKKVTI